TTSTNFSGTKEGASQDVKKDVSSLRYIALLNWFHEEHLETSTSNAQDACKADALKALCREFEALMHKKFQMSAMGELNFFLGLSANTPMDKENPWGKDRTSKDVDLYLYRSMIGSLMYLTESRPDIMFPICACARHQVTPKEYHMHAVKRIFRYLNSHPKLGIWYPKDSPFDLVAYSDSDYGGATQDRKSTTGGCQFLGRRLILWQCKKQTIVATSTTDVQYVAAATGLSCGIRVILANLSLLPLRTLGLHSDWVLVLQCEPSQSGTSLSICGFTVSCGIRVILANLSLLPLRTLGLHSDWVLVLQCGVTEFPILEIVQKIVRKEISVLSYLLTKPFDAGRFQYLVSQRNITGPLAIVSDSLASDYDSPDESLVCRTHLLLLKKLDGAEPGSGLKTVKLILKSKSTFKAEFLKDITLNEPSLAPTRGNKSSSASKTNSAPTGKLKNVKVEDDPPFAMVMKELNKLKLQINKKKSSYSRNKNTQQSCFVKSAKEPITELMINLNLCHPYIQIRIILVKVNLPQDPDLQDPQYLFLPAYIMDIIIIILMIVYTIPLVKYVEAMIITLMIIIGLFLKEDESILEILNMKRETPHAKKAESLNALRSKTLTKRFDTQVSLISVNEIKKILRNPTLLLLRELSELSTNMDIKNTSGGIYGKAGLNTIGNAIGAHCLHYSSKYVAPPSIDVVRKWFPMIGYGKEVSIKGTLRKSLLPPRWRLIMAQIIQCLGGKTGGFDQITNKDVIMLYSLANGIHIDYANIFWEDIILKLKKKQREKPGAKIGPKKPATSLKQPSMSSKEETKAIDSNPSRPLVSTHVDTKMHKEDQQATGGPTSLGVTSEERANPQLSSGMSALNLNNPIFSASFIIHSESASRHNVLVDFTTEADPGLSAPNDSIPPQQGMDEGTKNTSCDHISVGTDPYVLADQTKSVSKGLETVLTQTTTEKGASSTTTHGDKEEASTAIYGDKEEASSTIKLEDPAKLVSQIQPSFQDLDSPKDDHVIIADESDEDKPNAKTEDT
nr:hypothetical protein [Tanacetum cinerariifolium]